MPYQKVKDLDLYIGEDKDPDDRTRRFFGETYNNLISEKITIVGAGAVGNEVVKNLVMLGVRKIHLVDFDTVSGSNLNRCVFFRPEDHGKELKVNALANRVREYFPKAEIIPHPVHIQDAPPEVWNVPVIVVAVDDNEARHYINLRAFSCTPTPFLVNGAMGRTFVEVQILVPGKTACMVCPWSPKYAEQLFTRMVREKCDQFFYRTVTRFPAISVLTSILGGILSTEVTKILAGLPSWRQSGEWLNELKPALGSSIRYDIRNHEFSVGKIYRNPKCIEIFCRQNL